MRSAYEVPASEIVARAGTVLNQNIISLGTVTSLRIGFSTASGAINSCVLLASLRLTVEVLATSLRPLALPRILIHGIVDARCTQGHVLCVADHATARELLVSECSHVRVHHHSADRLTCWRHHTLGELAFPLLLLIGNPVRIKFE